MSEEPVIRRVPCLSDGAFQSLRDDLAEAKAGEPMVLAWNYVSKALDEIAWLRERERRLEIAVKRLDKGWELANGRALTRGLAAEEAEARVAELEAEPAREVMCHEMATHEAQRHSSRVSDLETLIRENVPLPWCPECKGECHQVDSEGCCLDCGTDAIAPTSQHVARVAELEKIHIAVVTRCPQTGNPILTQGGLDHLQALQDRALKAEGQVEVLEKRIEYAMRTASRRWEEWGGRAVSVCEILEGGDPYAGQRGEGESDA